MGRRELRGPQLVVGQRGHPQPIHIVLAHSLRKSRLAAATIALPPLLPIMGFAPTLDASSDGVMLSPVAAAAAGAALRAPYIIGTNQDEGSLFVSPPSNNRSFFCGNCQPLTISIIFVSWICF